MGRPTRVRPLSVRPGARFRCLGDGLCCSDVHALGPLTLPERRSLRLIAPEVVVRQPEVDAHVLQMGSDGTCLFLAGSRCELHAALGAAGKPGSCRRFPFGLTATPNGGRVTTEHRCPCRTLGERPPLAPADAVPSLSDRAGRLRADRRAPTLIKLGRRRQVPFAEWERVEAELLDQLAEGAEPAAVLDVPPFPTLRGADWNRVADELVEKHERRLAHATRASRFEVALAWFGDAVREAQGATDLPDRPRPWSDAFDRAEARTPQPEDPARIASDWLADEIWALGWTRTAPFDVIRADLATRIEVARRVARRMERTGTRPDRAMAEAITIVDLTGTATWWSHLIHRIRP